MAKKNKATAQPAPAAPPAPGFTRATMPALSIQRFLIPALAEPGWTDDLVAIDRAGEILGTQEFGQIAAGRVAPHASVTLDLSEVDLAIVRTACVHAVKSRKVGASPAATLALRALGLVQIQPKEEPKAEKSAEAKADQPK